MHALNYEDLREALVDTIERAGLVARVEEIIYVRDGARECEIYVYPDEESQGIWGKLSFEWVAHSQALWEDIDHEMEHGNDDLSGFDPEETEIPLHASFHLDLSPFWVETDMVREIAQGTIERASAYFNDEGSVIAEVSWSALGARVDSIRYEANAVGYFLTEETWWENWGEVFATLLGELLKAYRRLEEDERRAGS